MEILPFFSNSSDFVNLFNDFIDNYPAVKLSDQDVDTKFYIKVNSDRNEIYFHYLLNDIEEEFSYNYTENEQQAIKDYFGDSDFYLFDIQYKDELFLNNLLIDFQNFLKDRSELDFQKILLNHNIKGVVPLQDFEPGGGDMSTNG
jgi:hypothetical protein